MQLASKVGDAKKRKEVSVPLNDIIYDLSVDAFTSLANSFYEFSMKRREMLKSEAAKQRGKACDTVNVNVKCSSLKVVMSWVATPYHNAVWRRNAPKVKRMAAKSISNDRCRSSASAYNSEFEETSRGRQYSNFGRSHLNCKRHYEYQKPRFQKRYQSFPRQSR